MCHGKNRSDDLAREGEGCGPVNDRNLPRVGTTKVKRGQSQWDEEDEVVGEGY